MEAKDNSAVKLLDSGEHIGWLLSDGTARYFNDPTDADALRAAGLVKEADASEPAKHTPARWRVVTWSSATDRTFATRGEALSYVRSGPEGNDWHVEPNTAYRDLLELAAKAAGLVIYDWASEINCPLVEYIGVWDPLDDDGDALRLVVQLRISVQFGVVDNIDNVVTLSWRDKWKNLICLSTIIDDDPIAATRRAIVRAAAEIGRRLS